MQYDCVVFDLDGTLTASEEGICRCAAQAIERSGYSALTGEQLRTFIGPPLLYSFETTVGMTTEEAERAVGYYRERYSTLGWAENRVYEGIPRLLRTLKEAGVHLCVATGKPQIFTEKILEHFALRPYFERVVGITQEDHHADKQALIRAAVPEGCTRICMVGDRRFDIEAAVALGIDGCGALYGYGSREELTKAGAAMIAEKPEDLLKLLAPDITPADGIFCSIEGSDGCGKTTQTALLADWLRQCGWHVVHTREPGGCTMSEAIRSLVLDPAYSGLVSPECEAYLFAAARAQHVRATIRPALAEGSFVLCDRFVDSSAAFQGAGRELGVETVLQLNAMAVGGTLPLRTFFLDIDPDTALRRRLNATAPDRIEQEDRSFVWRVYNAFREIAEMHPERFTRIDANGSIDEIQQRLRESCKEIFAAFGNKTVSQSL